MKNIWIPHLARCGGMTLVRSIVNFCLFNHNKFELRFIVYHNKEFKKISLTTDITRKLRDAIDWQMEKGDAKNDRGMMYDALLDTYIKNRFYTQEEPGDIKKEPKFNDITKSKKPRFINFVEIKNKHTNAFLRIDHRNPLEQGMEDWVKILIIRDPIDRFISHFNHSKMKYWRKHKTISIETIDEYIRSNGHESNKPSEFKYWSYIDWLNVQQSRSEHELIEGAKMLFAKFTLEKVKEVFDHIVDLSNHNAVTNLLEESFFQQNVNWMNPNSSEKYVEKLNNFQNLIKFDIFRRTDLTNLQLRKINSLPIIVKDLVFYNKLIKK